MSRVVLFLVKVHQKQIAAEAGMITLLTGLDEALKARLKAEQDVIGYNMAAMRYMKQSFEEKAKGQKLAGP